MQKNPKTDSPNNQAAKRKPIAFTIVVIVMRVLVMTGGFRLTVRETGKRSALLIPSRTGKLISERFRIHMANL
jgi:hypothetical protein